MQCKRPSSVISNKITLQTWRLFSILCILLSVPAIILIQIALHIYRPMVKIMLRIQFKNKFIGLSKDIDSIWNIEDKTSLNDINFLIILEKTEHISNTIFLKELRSLINDRILSKATFEKLFYRRNEKFGYCFWERSEKIDLNDMIKWLECKNADCDGSCEDTSSESFRRILCSLSNRPFPDNNTALWEILVGRRCPRFTYPSKRGHLSPEKNFNTDNHKIPIVFRVHHSLCDGVAIVERLIKEIADGNETKLSKLTKIKNITLTGDNGKNFKEVTPLLLDRKKNFQNKTEIVRLYENNVLLASISYILVTLLQILTNLPNFYVPLKFLKSITVDSMKQLYEKIKDGVRLPIILLFAPGSVFYQIFLNIEESALHGPPQTGEKEMFYWFENDGNKSQLFKKICEIKKCTGARFVDIVLAAFSASLHKYYLKINESAPDALTVVLPITIATPENSTLDNQYSFIFMQLCISTVNGQTITKSNWNSLFFERLQDIIRTNHQFRKNQGNLINRWIGKYLAGLLPTKMMAAILSNSPTMGFSNIRGPQKLHISNNAVSNIAFWPPTTKKTALALALLSYGNNIHLSLIADKGIIKDERFFRKILEDTVHEIDSAYNQIRTEGHIDGREEIWTHSKKVM